MVNYQGPEAIRGLVEAIDVPIFNRIRQIDYSFNNLRDIQLNRADVSRMHGLERVSASKPGQKVVNQADAETVKAMIPPCRVASVDKTESQITIDVKLGSPLACPSR